MSYMYLVTEANHVHGIYELIKLGLELCILVLDVVSTFAEEPVVHPGNTSLLVYLLSLFSIHVINLESCRITPYTCY